MRSTASIDKAARLAEGSTADIYAWKDGTVLKLFKERTPWHANEVTATKVACKSGLPVPKVCSELIEVGQHEGIVFERIDGPTMLDYLENHPTKVEYCARCAANLHSRIHSTEVTDLPLLTELLSWSIRQADSLEEKTRKIVLDILNVLPAREILCHNDFYPNNIIMSQRGPIIIDWAIGTLGNPCADYARTWLISRMWLDRLKESEEPEKKKLMWQKFWDMFFHQHEELNPSCSKNRTQWQIVTTTASLVWDKNITSTKQRLSFINAALCNLEHSWLRC